MSDELLLRDEVGAMAPLPTPAEDAAFCEAMLPEVSRTFALSILALPVSLRSAVTVAYLLCRVVDTVEDTVGLAREERDLLFSAFEADLAGSSPAGRNFDACRHMLPGEGADHRLCLRASAVFRELARLPESLRAAIVPHVAEMSMGMREYATRGHSGDGVWTEDWDDLSRYCYYVAGTVGLLLDDLFLAVGEATWAGGEEARKSLAIALGRGLQLVNITKDLASDGARRVVFVPRSVLLEHGVASPNSTAEWPDEVRCAIRLELARSAVGQLRAGERYALGWGDVGAPSVRRFAAVPLVLAYATLSELGRPDPGELKVPREAVADALLEVERCVDDLSALANLFEVYRHRVECAIL